jgi:hypothetical protein
MCETQDDQISLKPVEPVAEQQHAFAGMRMQHGKDWRAP